jgi:hypothetical protein
MTSTNNPPNPKCVIDNVGGKRHPYSWCTKSVGEMVAGTNANPYGFDLTAKYIGGILNYADGLLSNPFNSISQDCSGILGNKYVLKTNNKCLEIDETGKKTGNEVTLYKYVNNVFDGASFITGGRPTTFKGLIPATLGAATNVNLMGVLNAFIDPDKPYCRKVNLKCHLVDKNNPSNNYNGNSGDVYLSNEDITDLNVEDFVNDIQPPIITNEQIVQQNFNTAASSTTATSETEQFNNIFNNNLTNKKLYNINYSKLEDDNLIKLYYTCFSLFLLFIVFKLLNK